MSTFQDTRLWRETLAPQDTDDAAQARDRLRDSYLAMRTRAVHVAQRIAVDLPDYTLHDESHFDALWEMSSLVVPEDMPLTPTEAFVLGGSFLIHDLGMGLAAFPDGLDDLRSQPLWRDSIALILRQRMGAWPSSEAIDDADESVQAATLKIVLRTLHAERAEWVATRPWSAPDGGQQFLIESEDLRKTYGYLIGRLAHSHWWPTAELEDEFSTTLGAPAWPAPQCPVSWTLDPLKLAAILRASDAIHLDARRAPRFLRTLRRPTPPGDLHWAFQEKLNRPIVERDRVVFTSATPFHRDESPAWWTGYDLLREVDRYLLDLDSLLASAGRKRLTARGVAALESPKHLAQHLPTEGWDPVNTEVHVSDVARLVRNLGGEELYGQNAPVALRELLQNASDAVRARRQVEERDDAFGRIIVSLKEADDLFFLEVEDNGVGMSTTVLTDVLLDFGRSYWESDLVAQELPGVMGSGFAPVGRYGIGFFSVLMLGDEITITTRRFNEAQRNTQVLEFHHGVNERPLLRPAEEGEYLVEGGTRVRVLLSEDPMQPEGLLWRYGREVWELAGLVAWLAPAVQVDICVEDHGPPTEVVSRMDWLRLPPQDLVRRTYAPEYNREQRLARLLELAENMRELPGDGRPPAGRAFIYPATSYGVLGEPSNAGVVTIGGLRSVTVDSIAGVLDGLPERASRDAAFPTVREEDLAHWATDQAALAVTLIEEPERQSDVAATVLVCRGDPGALMFAQTADGWLTLGELGPWAAERSEIVVSTNFEIPLERLRGTAVKLAPNVIWIPAKYVFIMEPSARDLIEWPPQSFFVRASDYSRQGGDYVDPPPWVWTVRNSPLGAVVSAVSTAWSVEPVAVLKASKVAFVSSELYEVGTRDASPFRLSPEAILRLPS